ncbi:MAG TPA: ABC transporter substrate-binding protein [Euzebyales bacterium]|nr:ABC transporter substrate-binding protein [Euzebyales bacterium]
MLAGALVLALMLTACGGPAAQAPEEDAPDAQASAPEDGSQDEAAAGDLTPVTFALTNQRAIQYHPYYVAQYLGYFEDEGLEVEIVIVDGSSAAVQQTVAGNVDISNPSAPATAQAAAQGNCVQQFYTGSYGNVFDFVTPESTGITDLAGLEGQTVGVSAPGGGEIPLVRAILAGAGLDENSDYQMLPIGEGGPVTFQALEAGDAQAYSSSVFDIAAVSAAGLPMRSLLPEEFAYFPTVSLVTTCDYFEANQDVLAGFARAVSKAKVFTEANDQGARDIARHYEPELFEDEALANEFWERTLALDAPPPALEGEPLGSHYIEGWETYLQFASEGTVEEGALDADAIDLEALLPTDIIEPANDFDREEVIAEAEAFEGVE